MNTIPESIWMTESRVDQGLRMIRAAHKLYRPRKVWALCSGGNDSLCSTHLAMSTGLCDGVVSINTTIGIQQTRDHLTGVCERFGWPLRWYFPPESYKSICGRYGMPGPGAHGRIYIRLKERCVRQLCRDSIISKRDRVMLITGVRAGESVRRMGNTAALERRGREVWTNPIINWDGEDKTLYQVENAIPFNPVTVKLGISGECLCGAYAKPGEREKIERHYPEAFSLIVRCEQAAAANCKPASWGTAPVRSGHLCQQCDRKNELEVA